MNELIIIILLILFNGILAMSEIALISARKTYLSSEAKRGSKSAKVALKLANEPDKFLSIIQIGITVIGILTGIFSGAALADDFSAILKNWGVSPLYAHSLSQAIIVIVVTYLTLIFGELVPKRIGMSMAEKAAKVVARPMYILSIITSPFVWLLSKSTNFIFNLFGLKSDVGKVTEAEIKSLVEEGARDGAVQEVEQDIVERVFLMGDLKVCSLMTHKSEVVALDVKMNGEQIKRVIEKDMCEIYPVIDSSFDNVEGVVQLKDVVFKLDQPDFTLRDVLRSPVYFYENQSVYKVLEVMKEQHLSEALICDEFGSCEGIITLKDILEGLVGEIEQTQHEPNIIKRIEDDSWLVDGQCPMHDFLLYFDQEEMYDPNNEYNTLGGLILDLGQHIPQSGEKLRWQNFELEVVDMDGVRIDKVLVNKIELPSVE